MTVPGAPAGPAPQDPGTLRAAGRMLLARPDRLLVPALALTVLGLIANVLLQWWLGAKVAGSAPCVRVFLGDRLRVDCGPEDSRAQIAAVLGLFVLFLVGHLVAAGLSRASLDLIDGGPSRGVLGGWSVLRALPAALVVSLLLTVATVFLVLPGLVAGFLLRYVMTFVVDRRLGVLAAISASVHLVSNDLRSEIGFAARSAVLLLAGLLAVGVGLFVALPWVLLAQTARYRARVP